MITKQSSLNTSNALDYSKLRHAITESFEPSLVWIIAVLVEIMKNDPMHNLILA